MFLHQNHEQQLNSATKTKQKSVSLRKQYKHIHGATERYVQDSVISKTMHNHTLYVFQIFSYLILARLVQRVMLLINYVWIVRILKNIDIMIGDAQYSLLLSFMRCLPFVFTLINWIIIAKVNYYLRMIPLSLWIVLIFVKTKALNDALTPRLPWLNNGITTSTLEHKIRGFCLT